MIEYLLFDLDGTLCDTGPGIMGSVQNALTRLGWDEQPESFLRQFVGPPLFDSFTSFCKFDEPQALHAIELYRERYNTWGVYESPLYPGIKEALKHLAQRAVLCIATSKREQGARKILKMRGIEDIFQLVAGDDGTRPTKAQVISHVLEGLRAMGHRPQAGSVLMIGDRSYDVVGAKACGIQSLGTLYGYSLQGELKEAGADYLAESVEELEQLCLGLV